MSSICFSGRNNIYSTGGREEGQHIYQAPTVYNLHYQKNNT